MIGFLGSFSIPRYFTMSIAIVTDRLLDIANLFNASSLTRTATSIFITFKKVLKYEKQQETPIGKWFP